MHDVSINVLDNISFSEIKPSSVHGFGLFATTSIKAGTILGTLDGQVINWDQYDKICQSLSLPPKSKESIFMEWNALSKETLLVRPIRTKYSFINHSRTPNLRLEHNPLRVVALLDISEGDELFLDYRKEPLRNEYLEGHGKTYL